MVVIEFLDAYFVISKIMCVCVYIYIYLTVCLCEAGHVRLSRQFKKNYLLLVIIVGQFSVFKINGIVLKIVIS